MALSDEALVAGMASGDADAAAAFVRRFQARVLGMARSVVGDPDLAEEVAQEAFVRVWLRAAGYDPHRAPAAAWVLTITRNLAVDAARRRRRTEPELLPCPLAPPAPPVPDDAAGDGLAAALRALPPEQSRPIVLSAVYGLTAKEIAEWDGLPLGTVKTRIRLGLAKLRDRLG